MKSVAERHTKNRLAITDSGFKYVLRVGLKAVVQIHSLHMKSRAKVSCHDRFLNDFVSLWIQKIAIFINTESQESHALVIRVKKDVWM